MADIVSDCTDPGKIPSGQDPEPWPVRKQRFIACPDSKPRASLLVTTADKAHNSRDHLLDAGVDPERWNKFLPRFDGLAWYFWSLSHKLRALLPESRSVKILGQTVSALLTNPVLIDRLPPWQDPEDWLAGYLDRPDTHPLP